MTLPKNVAELQGENVLFELECIDRMYLNLYVPQLASAPGVAAYFRGYKGHRFASTKDAVAMSEGFRRQVLDFAEEVIRENIDLGRPETVQLIFVRKMRKPTVAAADAGRYWAPLPFAYSSFTMGLIFCLAGIAR